MLLEGAGEGVQVLRRQPVDAPKGTDRLCRRFGGDGRAGAGGIDRLAADDLEAFARAFEQHDWGR